MAKKKSSMLGNMIGMGVGNIVGAGLIGATAGTIAAIPTTSIGATSPTRTILNQVPAFQSTALLGENIRVAKGSLGMGTPSRRRARSKVRSRKAYY